MVFGVDTMDKIGEKTRFKKPTNEHSVRWIDKKNRST